MPGRLAAVVDGTFEGVVQTRMEGSLKKENFVDGAGIRHMSGADLPMRAVEVVEVHGEMLNGMPGMRGGGRRIGRVITRLEQTLEDRI